MCQTRRAPKSIMDIYGQDQGSHQSARFDGKRRRSGGSELSRRFAEARRSGACADETQYGTILAAKIVLFLLGISIKPEQGRAAAEGERLAAGTEKRAEKRKNPGKIRLTHANYPRMCPGFCVIAERSMPLAPWQRRRLLCFDTAVFTRLHRSGARPLLPRRPRRRTHAGRRQRAGCDRSAAHLQEPARPAPGRRRSSSHR